MSFVNEDIPDSAKLRIEWSRFKAMPTMDPHRPWKWLIDRERDAFVVPLDLPGRDDTGTRAAAFALCWHDQIICFDARVTGSGGGKFWTHLSWVVEPINSPRTLKLDQHELQQMVREALTAYG